MLYEPPLAPDCVISTEHASEADCADALMRFIKRHARFQSDLPHRAHDPVSFALSLL